VLRLKTARWLRSLSRWADAAESERLFGVPLARRGLQPVYLRIYNHSDKHLRLHLVSIDPNYYTPLEAAALNHFSMAKRLSAFGAVAWLFFFAVAGPDSLQAHHGLPCQPADRRVFFGRWHFIFVRFHRGARRKGFVFTTLDLGIKIVHIRLLASGGLLETLNRGSATDREVGAPTPAAQGHKIIGSVATDYTFSLAVPGIAADYHRRDFATLFDPSSIVKCDLAALVDRLRCMPAATTNEKGTGTGDPVNLVVIGTFDMLLSAFSARWDESETITLATCWKNGSRVSSRLAVPVLAREPALFIQPQPRHRSATQPPLD
jgi:hypothetical protein